MQSDTKQHWRFQRLLWLLIGCSVDSSSLYPSTTILSEVGQQVVLPCSWKERLTGKQAVSSVCHVLWATADGTVLELSGEKGWEVEELRGRAEVPRGKLESGDCSLVISDVQLSDSGTYDGFMVVEGARASKTRVSIQSVRLAVRDYKSRQSRGPGEDLVLDLHTVHSMRVVFQGRSDSQWSDLWMRGDADGVRLQKHPLKEQLTLRSLTRSDEGTYRVVDEHGLAVSTLQLSVEDQPNAVKFQQVLEDSVRAVSSARGNCPDLLIWSVLVAGFQILLLH